MKLNYKLGELIRNIDVKNKDLHCNNLKGLSMTKEFRASTSNIVGTDLSKYKIVAYKQFACDFMSAIRVHKMPIAFNSEMEEILVSPAYAVFEVIDENIILPEYLMMWFRRSEFDRYADFRSDAAIRGGYGWNELCETEIKLPSLEEQRKIVQAYKTITNRIELKKKINDNLANQIASIYEDYFVSFNHTSTESYIDSPFGEIPSDFQVLTIGELGCDISDGNYSSKYPKADEFVSEGIPFIRGVDFIGTNISKRHLLYISAEKHRELLKGHTKKNDILITTRGVGIGKIAFVPNDMIGVNINSQLIRINGGDMYPRVFLSQSFLSKRGQNEIQANIT